MRAPAVAGQFYPADSKELNALLDTLFMGSEKEHNAIAGVTPHAGLVYSGSTAAQTWNNVDLSKTIVLVGPDHTGKGQGETCVDTSDAWETPLGSVGVDVPIAKALASEFSDNGEAHSDEHSLEVQLPLIQRIAPKARIVPVMMGDQSLGSSQKLAAALAKHDVTVVASSDYSHYVTPHKAKENDGYAIEALCKLDVNGFYSRILEMDITTCGYGPQAVAALYAKEKGATKGVLLEYSTSPGDRVVGYASIVFL